jgi:hypothetical protein
MSTNGDDSDSVMFALSQIRTEKSVNALAAIVQDKTRPAPVRQNAIFWLRSMKIPEATQTLQNLRK